MATNAPKHLICPKCGNILREPKMLECLHSYCKECLVDIVQCESGEVERSLKYPKMACSPICGQINDLNVSFMYY